MTTQKSAKALVEFTKTVEGNLFVYSFDYTTRKRVSTYMGLDAVTALQEAMYRLAEGKLVVITNTEGYDILSKIEMETRQRINYDCALPYSVVVKCLHSENDWYIRKLQPSAWK